MTMETGNEQQTVGVILVTHSDYGSALLCATEAILGPLQDCCAIGLDTSQAPSETAERLQDAVKRLDRGVGVILLTDMFGGTPTNMSLSLMGNCQVDVVTGVNLPMLLKVFSARHLDLFELSAQARDAGIKGIVAAGEMLRSKVKPGQA